LTGQVLAWKTYCAHAHNIQEEGWASFAGENLPAIIWQGNQYDPYPYELKGVELSSAGSQADPHSLSGMSVTT
jgi:phage-related protein